MPREEKNEKEGREKGRKRKREERHDNSVRDNDNGRAYFNGRCNRDNKQASHHHQHHHNRYLIYLLELDMMGTQVCV